MAEPLNRKQREEASFVLGEMAAGRLFALVHERIEELRQNNELSYHDIADRIGATDQQVSRWLSEPRNMTVRSAGRLLAGLEAHLLFELDRFESIHAGNCPAKEVTQATITRAPHQMVVRSPDTVAISPKMRTLLPA